MSTRAIEGSASGYRGIPGHLDPARGRVLKSESRTILWRETLRNGDRTVVKMYRRRGRLVFWRGRVFRFRVQREYETLSHLRDSGVRSPEPLFWTRGESRGHGRYEVLATREVAGAVSLRSLARQGERELIVSALPDVLRVVRRMHEVGVYHGALKIDNVGMSRMPDGRSECYVMDTPRALVFPESIVGTPMARRDLRHLTYTLGEWAGVLPDEIPLKAYGMGEEEQRRFRRRVPRFRRTKRRRRFLRLAFLVRLLFARLSVRSGGMALRTAMGPAQASFRAFTARNSDFANPLDDTTDRRRAAPR